MFKDTFSTVRLPVHCVSLAPKNRKSAYSKGKPTSYKSHVVLLLHGFSIQLLPLRDTGKTNMNSHQYLNLMDSEPANGKLYVYYTSSETIC